MDAHITIKLINLLIENARRIMAEGFGVDWAESSFFDVIRVLREEEPMKGYFLHRVRTSLAMPVPALLEPGMIPIELIELVAHELRWPELRDLANERISTVYRGDALLAAGDIASRIFDAYSDAWGDRVFYRQYGEN